LYITGSRQNKEEERETFLLISRTLLVISTVEIISPSSSSCTSPTCLEDKPVSLLAIHKIKWKKIQSKEGLRIYRYKVKRRNGLT